MVVEQSSLSLWTTHNPLVPVRTPLSPPDALAWTITGKVTSNRTLGGHSGYRGQFRPIPPSPRVSSMPDQAPPRSAVHVDPALREESVARLRRIEGQVRGLQRMVEEGRYCADILTQVSSVHEALRAVGKLLMQNHLQHCITDALRSGDGEEAERAYQEVLDLMYKHAR